MRPVRSSTVRGWTLLLSGLVAGCITEPDLKRPYVSFVPETLDDGWVVSTPAAEGIDAEMVGDVYRRAFASDAFPTLRSLLVVRHGRLVAEAYVRDPAERRRLHHVQSVTKSVTAILAGIALDRGLLDSVHTPVSLVLPAVFDDDPRKRAITLHHVLSMQTGLQFSNERDTGPFVHSRGSSLAFVLQREPRVAPGVAFDYHDGNPQLVSGMIQAVAGLSLEGFARQQLFEPMGIREFRWDRHRDGLTFGAFGLWLRPRDLAKIGALLAGGGLWHGQHIVSAAWLAQATQPQTARGDYGYYFWLLDDGSFQARGHGGQIIRVWPTLDLVVVATADPYSDEARLSPGLSELVAAISAAVGAQQ